MIWRGAQPAAYLTASYAAHAHYGTSTPEFQRQSRQFALALQVAGKPARVVVGPGYNHFEMLETLRNPYGIMGRAALEMMNLAT